MHFSVYANYSSKFIKKKTSNVLLTVVIFIIILFPLHFTSSTFCCCCCMDYFIPCKQTDRNHYCKNCGCYFGRAMKHSAIKPKKLIDKS